jgi:uncharacterized protein
VLALFDGTAAAAQPEALRRVRALVRRYEYATALEALEAAAGEGTLDPLDVLHYRGYLHGELGDGERALASFREALARDPGALEFHFHAANALRLMKRADEALREYDVAIARRPDAPFHRYHKSNYLRELNRHEEAVAEMDALLARAPHRYDYSFHKANSLRSLGRHEEAIAAIENAIARDPSNPLYRLHKAQSLALLRREAEAVAEMDAAIGLRRDAADLHGERARMLHAFGRTDAARTALCESLRLDPRHGPALRLQAELGR